MHHYRNNDPLRHEVEKTLEWLTKQNRKLATGPVTLHQSLQMRVSASSPLSTNAAVHSHMCACGCVRYCAQGKGNEDRWGSFILTGSTRREGS